MDEEKEYDIDDEQEENSDGYYDMSDDYDDDYNDNYNDYSYSSSQPNRFINNFKNKQNKNDESNLAEAKENGAKKNSQTANNKSEKNQKGNKQQGNKTDDTLKKNIGKQAGEKPKESNIAKGGPSGSSGGSGADMAKKMAVDKAKNTMNSIHDNNKANESNSEKKSGSDKSEDGEKKDEKGAVASKIEQAKQAGQQAGKEILSKAITAETGIPKPIADKIAEKAMNKQMKKQKIQMYAIIAVLFFFFMIIVGFVFDDEDQKNEDTNNSIKNFYAGTMSDEEFFNSLINTGIVDEEACIENGKFNSDCDFMKFVYKIKNGVTGSNQFLYIFYAISYNREYLDYINNDDELKALLEHKDSLSTYLNGDYLTKYRNDLDSDFDLYEYVKEKASKGDSTSSSTGLSVCDTIKVNGVKLDSGEKVDGYIVDFEEYVAGVIKHEMFFPTDSQYGEKYYEATKALAVAARTYAYRITEGCTKPIENSTNYQTFSIIDSNNEHDKKVLDLVKEVSGILMKDSSGNLVSGQYDSFCYSSYNSSTQTYHLHQGNIDIPKSWTSDINIEGRGDTEFITKKGTHTSGWIRLHCPCNNSSHNNNVDTSNGDCVEDSTGNYLDGGHGNGLSQYGALYLSEKENLKYDEILKRFYGDDIVLEKPSSELERDPVTGFMERKSPMALFNKYYPENSTNYIIGECVWYAYMRANEILDSWGSSKKWTYGGDGGQICRDSSYNKYRRNSGNLIDDASLDEIQEGDVIAWLDSINGNGHIAIIEKVNRDSSGRVISADVSQGGLGLYTSSTYNKGKVSSIVTVSGESKSYDMKNYKSKPRCSEYASCASRNFVNEYTKWPGNRARRIALCESYGTNCQSKDTFNREQLKYYYDYKYSSCIIDLKAYSEG